MTEANTNTNTNTITKANEEPRKTTVFTPQVDIFETDAAVCLVAELPGVSEKNVAVDLQGNTLTIRGTTEFQVPEGLKIACGEYTPDRIYERQFTLGDTIDQDAITASMKDGLLKLVLPIVKEHTSRKIVVRTE